MKNPRTNRAVVATRILKFPVVFAISLCAVGSAMAQSDCYYTWDRIRLPDVYCVGWDINNIGHVAGEIDTGGDASRAFYWTPEGGVEILPLPPGVITMSAYAINDHDQIAGIMGDGDWYGFVWSPVDGYTIIDFPHPSANVYVTDINNNGEVVGSVLRRVIPAPLEWDPFVWHNGELTFFGNFFGQTPAFARGINDLGDIVGYAYEVGSGNLWHAFIVRGGSDFAWLPEPEGFSKTVAEAINNHGMIVGNGRSVVAGRTVGLAWTQWGVDSVPPPVDATAAYFTAVNDRQQAVGRFTGPFDRPFLWTAGTTVDLLQIMSPAPAAISGAESINNSGRIVVAGGNSTLLLSAQWLECDLTGDCHVGLEDLAIILAEFGSESEFAQAGDIDFNGEVDLVDLANLLSHFGE